MVIGANLRSVRVLATGHYRVTYGLTQLTD